MSALLSLHCPTPRRALVRARARACTARDVCAVPAYRTACYFLAYGSHIPLPLGVRQERRWGFVQYNVYAITALTNVITLQQYGALCTTGRFAATRLLWMMHLNGCRRT